MAGRTKRPVSFETIVRTMPVVSSVRVTVTPGRTLPDWSDAIPFSSATAPCPRTEPTDINTITPMHAISRSMSASFVVRHKASLGFVGFPRLRQILGRTVSSVKINYCEGVGGPGVAEGEDEAVRPK